MEEMPLQKKTSKSNSYSVTIALPVYNGSEVVEDALNSLLQQSYKNFQIIICDDNSTDCTFDLCKKFAEHSDNIRVLRNEKNLGPQKNLLKILQMSNTDFFVWASQDDYWHSEYLSLLVKTFHSHKSAVLAVCDMSLFSSKGDGQQLTFSGRWNPEKLSRIELLASILIPLKSFSYLKTNLYLHGLIRTSSLKLVASKLLTFSGHDRVWVALLALQGGFSYVEKEMYFRRVDFGYELRRKKGVRGIFDVLSTFWLSVIDLVQFSQGICRSKFKTNYKFQFFLIAVVYFLYRLISLTKLLIVSCLLREIIGDRIYFTLRRIYRKILDR